MCGKPGGTSLVLGADFLPPSGTERSEVVSEVKVKVKVRVKVKSKRSFYFYETFICYRGCLKFNFYISKKVQKNLLMGLKIW